MPTANYQWLTLIFSALGILLIPAVVMVWRVSRNWAQIQAKVDQLSRDAEEMKAWQQAHPPPPD